MGRPKPADLQTAADVIDALGGLAKVSKITGSQYSAVWNWKASGSFPPKTYVAITSALQAIGASAAPEMWGMISQQAAE